MITHEEFIKEYNLVNGSDYFQNNEWLYILNLKKDFNIIIDELPSKIEFTKNCNINITLKNIKKIPPNVIFNNNGNVGIPYVEEISENVIFNNNGEVHLLGDLVSKDYNIGKLKKIHPSVKFINTGNIYLYNIIDKIPSGVVFENIGGVGLHHVKEISENVIFSNSGNLYLSELEEVHPSVKFINKGDIYFNYGVNKIPKGLIFNNRGNVIIPKTIEYISDIIFNNDGNVEFEEKPVISQNVHFNNKGIIKNKPINIPDFLDPEKYLNKMIKQLSK